MEADEIIPRMVEHVTTNRSDMLIRLRVLANEATGNIDRFMRRGKLREAQYYAGKRDAYLHAVNMLESE